MTKLSTLIREGAKKRPQAFGNYLEMTNDLNPEGVPYAYSTCAIGAAYEALTGELPDYAEFDRDLNERTLKTVNAWSACIPYPEGTDPKGGEDSVNDVVVNLNDDYRWTRERIADYLESVGQ